MVDISDVIMIARIFGLKQGSPNFDSNCDIDGDGKITILDLVDCITYYGVGLQKARVKQQIWHESENQGTLLISKRRALPILSVCSL
jgi:hypothetical protein